MSARRTFARPIALSATVVALGILTTVPATAHVTVTPGEGAAGTYAVGTFSVGHGCDGSPTTEITIKIPDELTSVTPTLNAGWEVTKNVVTLDEPVEDAHGNEVTERVDTVVYTARTPLPDGYRDTFALSFQVPDAAGTTLVFPTVQKCVKGQNDWIEVAAVGAEEPERPAPTFRVLEGTGDGHGATAEHEDASATTDDDAAPKGLAYAGLGVGALGLLTAAGALARTRTRAGA